MYKILDFALLPEITHIIWDVTGTITDPDGDLSQEVAAKIINLAMRGVYHSFVTGRDAGWMIRHVVEPVKAFIYFPRVSNNLAFFAEYGAIRIEVDSGGEPATCLIDLERHPFATTSVTEELRSLAYDPEKLEEYREGKIDADHRVIYDAESGPDRKAYLVDIRDPWPKLHPYIWCTRKRTLATYDIIRDAEGRVRRLDQDPFVELLEDVLASSGLSEAFRVRASDTAIDVLPVLDGVRLGKEWAAGSALQHIWAVKTARSVALDSVVRRTIVFGDGKSDFDFTTPTIPAELHGRLDKTTLPIVFVGPDSALPKDRALRDNMIIRGTGLGELVYEGSQEVIRLRHARGPRVVSAVLKFLSDWGYFAPF